MKQNTYWKTKGKVWYQKNDDSQLSEEYSSPSDEQFYLEHGSKKKALKFAKIAKHSSSPETMKGIRYEGGED